MRYKSLVLIAFLGIGALFLAQQLFVVESQRGVELRRMSQLKSLVSHITMAAMEQGNFPASPAEFATALSDDERRLLATLSYRQPEGEGAPPQVMLYLRNWKSSPRSYFMVVFSDGSVRRVEADDMPLYVTGGQGL